jgi:flavin-dependent thymidylate synthase
VPGQNNQVELIDTYGGDETHALSAWTSTSRDLTPEKRGRMEKLLTQLARDGHHSPFEKSAIHFLVTTEIATHIQIIKHRIGVPFNAESARYKELKDDKFYLPVDWDQDELDLYSSHMEQCFERYHAAVERLVSKGISRKRAKESARFYIPYGNQLTADVMFNFRSFNHFLGLRYSNHAQLEIRNLAGEMLRQVAQKGGFEMTLRAFGYADADGNIRPPSE